MYSFAFLVYMLLASPFYLARVLRGRYRGSFLQRLGIRIARPSAGSSSRVWIHACSVGEVEAAAPFIRMMSERKPGTALTISTVTETGQARARALFPEHDVRYLPFDFLFSIRRHFRAVGAMEKFVIMETEIWPNLISELHRLKIPTHVLNGRISDRAWPRYRRFASIFRPIVSRLTSVAARGAEDAARFRHLGARMVKETGNIKYDRPIAEPPQLRPRGRLIVFGSTHPGEEEICVRVLRALQHDLPDLRAIIAPRHIERARSLADLGNTSFRSTGWSDSADILVLDTHGELSGIYGLAAAAFIGGSFVPHGGHNPLEAAVHGVPVVWGPHVGNFRDACGVLEQNGGFAVEDGDELTAILRKLLWDEQYRLREGALAAAAVARNRGACEKAWRLFWDGDIPS